VGVTVADAGIAHAIVSGITGPLDNGSGAAIARLGTVPHEAAHRLWLALAAFFL